MKSLSIADFNVSFRKPGHYPIIVLDLCIHTVRCIIFSWAILLFVIYPLCLLGIACVDLAGTTGSFVWHNYLTDDPGWYQWMSWEDHWQWYHRGPDAVPMAWRKGQ